jgi:hypothetical protein
MIYSLMHGWDGELMDREDDQMEQGKRRGDGWDGELKDGDDDDVEKGDI